MGDTCYFGPGPCLMPEFVRVSLQKRFFERGVLPASPLECSHRLPALQDILRRVHSDFRQVFQIPENYAVLFCSGGTRHHYGMIPLNLLSRDSSLTLGCLVSGYWSAMMAEASASQYASQTHSYPLLPVERGLFDTALCQHDFVHIVANETLEGLSLPHPVCAHPALIADVTSDLGFRVIPVDQYGLLYGGLQKLIGVSGMSVCIISQDILARCADDLPFMQGYREMARYDSMQGTPNVFAWLSLGVMLEWMREQGGVGVLVRRQRERAKQLHGCLNQLPGVQYLAPDTLLSMQNIAFTFAEGGRDRHFLSLAKSAGLFGLEGHAARGGVRINLYHGVDDTAFARLCNFVSDYAQNYQETTCV